MRIVIDYRPALRARTGVGEYIHQTIKALAKTGDDQITLFSSSWKDRPAPDLTSEVPNVRIVDQRIPVRALNVAWHRLGWPPVEAVAGGSYDIAHSPHPLLLPSRSAAQLVTIHDLHFLTHPERTADEIKRDYPALAAVHARRADRIIVSSAFAASEVRSKFDIANEKISICPAGAAEWQAALQGGDPNGYILFVGTLDPRKNIGGLLQAYGQIVSRDAAAPKLVIAGGASDRAAEWLRQIAQPPLAGRVDYLGYVPAERREELFRGARVFVLPSFEEGFGLTALDAMAAGIPVVASDRGALPELVGDSGLLIDPEDSAGIAHAIERVSSDSQLRMNLSRRALERSKEFTWTRTATAVRQAYEMALTNRRERTPAPAHAHRH